VGGISTNCGQTKRDTLGWAKITAPKQGGQVSQRVLPEMNGRPPKPHFPGKPGRTKAAEDCGTATRRELFPKIPRGEDFPGGHPKSIRGGEGGDTARNPRFECPAQKSTISRHRQDESGSTGLTHPAILRVTRWSPGFLE
jgi:hypothetical protein